jgi:hypothetical protein
MHAIQLLAQQKIDADTLKNGVSYFLGPLLNWTLVGVIKSLVKDVQARGSDFLSISSIFLGPGLISEPQILARCTISGNRLDVAFV